MTIDKIQKNVKIDADDAEWLERNPHVNFSALCRKALKEEREMREQYGSDDEPSEDERTI